MPTDDTNAIDDSFDEIAQELRKEYVLDAKEHIETIENLVVTLEREQTLGRGDVDRLFRAYHTIKGNSALVGFDNVRDLAHIVESVIGQFRSGEMAMTSKVADIILSSVDMLKKMVAEVETFGKPTADASTLIARITEFKDTYRVVQTAPFAASKTAPKPAAKQAQQAVPAQKQVMKVRTAGNLAILQLPASLGENLKSDFINYIKNYQKRGISKFVLNFEATRTINDSGINLIHAVREEIESSGGKLASCELPLDVMFAFNNSGSTDNINSHSGLREAVLSLNWP